MIKITKIKIQKIKQLFVLLIFLSGTQAPVYGQVQFDYISDWSNIFLSNINLISVKEISASDQSHQPSSNYVSFSSQMTFNDFYREQRGDLERQLSNYQQSTKIRSQFGINEQIFVFAAEYGLSQKKFKFDLEKNQSLQLKNYFKEYRFFISTFLFQDCIQLTGGLGRKLVEKFEYNPWNLGITVKPSRYLSLSYNRYEDMFRWQYNLEYEHSASLLISDEYSQLDEYRIGLTLIPELSIMAMMQNNYINKDRSADDPGTILVPTGTHYQRHISVNFFPDKIVGVNLYYYNRNHDLVGYFYDTYQIFGKLTVQRDHSERYQSEFIYRNRSQKIRLLFGYAKGNVNNNGHVESWPFTPTVVDLLGLRYNFKSSMAYKLFNIGASYQYRGIQWGVILKACFERINPGGSAKTWEPEMLVFGIKNVNEYSLPDKHWDGAYFGICLTKSFGKLLQITYEFNQYIPLELSSSKQAAMKPIVEEYDKSIYGGGKHQLSIMINI